jgi:hypothetical protein
MTGASSVLMAPSNCWVRQSMASAGTFIAQDPLRSDPPIKQRQAAGRDPASTAGRHRESAGAGWQDKRIARAVDVPRDAGVDMTEQQVVGPKDQIEEHDQELNAARAANRELTTNINRRT